MTFFTVISFFYIEQRNFPATVSYRVLFLSPKKETRYNKCTWYLFIVDEFLFQDLIQVQDALESPYKKSVFQNQFLPQKSSCQ